MIICNGCKKKIFPYHEAIIDMNAFGEAKITLWHYKCFIKRLKLEGEVE